MKGDLSVTALYTSAVWSWGGLAQAELFATKDAERIFDATNVVLAAARFFRRDLPNLRASLLQRHLIIDRLLAESGAKQVLELAAGLSRRGATVSADSGTRYTEVDLAPVIAKKTALLARSPQGRAVLARPNYRVVGADVEDEPLGALVSEGALLVIAEGLLMYLDRARQLRLFERVRALSEIARPLRFVFDLVPPVEQPPAGKIGGALEAVMKRFTGGRTFEKERRTRDEVVSDLRTAGFSSVEVFDARAVAQPWGLPYAAERTQMVVFSAMA